MAPDPSSRDLDLVLMGATGFTGALTAAYLARHAPASMRWGLAGRDLTRLAAVRDRLTGIDPRLEVMELLSADATDRASLDAVARRARVVVTTVGPYVRYGDALVAACAAAGTDYADLCGEAEFVDRTYVRHHAQAVETGARLVHACGFDSVPHDLGALYTVQQLRPQGPMDLRGVVRASGALSGGTLASAMDAFGRVRESREAARERRGVEPRPTDRSSRAVAGRPRRDAHLGLWLVPLPTIDPQVVARSGAALTSYGPRFRYSHFAGTRRLTSAVGAGAALTGLVGAAQLPPLRRAVTGRVPQGTGPSAEKRSRSWFRVDFVGEVEGTRVHTRVSGGDPGYGDTAMMLAESALSLAFDQNPAVAGQVTTAVALGPNLLARLASAGMRFETLG